MFLQGHFLPLGLGQAHSDHPLGLEATEATSGLDYTSAGDVAFSCLSLVALNSSGHLEPEQAVVGKDTGPAWPPRGSKAARVVLRGGGLVPACETTLHLLLPPHPFLKRKHLLNPNIVLRKSMC